MKRLQATPPTIDWLNEASELCYWQLYRQATLADFQIRRMKFVQQTYDEQILLWMVVAITISGVCLAAVQLIASYKLAAAGRGDFDKSSEISLERDRVSLRSSVTGLLILVVSFAFFSVFVWEIYTIKEVTQPGAPETLAYQQIGAGVLDSFPDEVEATPAASSELESDNAR